MLQYAFSSLAVATEKPKLGLVVTVTAGVINMVGDALFPLSSQGLPYLVPLSLQPSMMDLHWQSFHSSEHFCLNALP